MGKRKVSRSRQRGSSPTDDEAELKLINAVREDQWLKELAAHAGATSIADVISLATERLAESTGFTKPRQKNLSLSDLASLRSSLQPKESPEK